MHYVANPLCSAPTQAFLVSTEAVKRTLKRPYRDVRLVTRDPAHELFSFCLVHPTPPRADGGERYVPELTECPTFTPSPCWAASVLRGRAACRREAAPRGANLAFFNPCQKLG